MKREKQRKFRYNAPLHVRQKLVSAHLSPELRKKHGVRSCGIKKNDIVKVMSGQFKGKSAKVVRVNLTRLKVFVEGIENIRKDGTKSFYPMEPSNLMITELNLEDKKRKQMLEKGKKPKGKEQ